MGSSYFCVQAWILFQSKDFEKMLGIAWWNYLAIAQAWSYDKLVADLPFTILETFQYFPNS